MRIKFCVASRPENIFETYLSEYDGFKIQDHTKKDIETYTSGRLYENSTRRSSTFKEQLPVLVDDIVKLSAGIFLWVKLVVEEMIECICEGDTIPELRNLLSRIPTKMEGLYARAIGRMNDRKVSKEVKERWARETLFMFKYMTSSHFEVINETGRLPMISTAVELVHTVHCLMQPISDKEGFVQSLSKEEALQWIVGRSAGLLECVVIRTVESFGTFTIQFIHQTAKDFVTSGQVPIILAPSLGKFSEKDVEEVWRRFYETTL